MANKIVLVYLNMLMDQLMKGIGKMTYKKDKERTLGQTEEIIKDPGKMGKWIS